VTLLTLLLLLPVHSNSYDTMLLSLPVVRIVLTASTRLNVTPVYRAEI
jgi:hypothetical protein